MIEFSFGIEFSLSVGYWFGVHLISCFDYDVMFGCKSSFQSNLFLYTCSPTPTKGSISVNDDAILWMVQVQQILQSSTTPRSSHIQNQVSSIFRVSLPLALSHSSLSLFLFLHQNIPQLFWSFLLLPFWSKSQFDFAWITEIA